MRSPRCNYPEMILERFLFLRGIPARYSRGICYVRTASCGELREDHCGPAVPQRLRGSGGFPSDLAKFWGRAFWDKETLANA